MPAKQDQFRVDVGRRLEQLRRSLEFEKLRPFAKKIDVPEDTYIKWEKGKALIPPQQVMELKRRFGITADWLYFGDMAALSPALKTELLNAA